MLKGIVNGVQVFDVKVPSTVPTHGFVVYGTDTMGYGYFDNFLITP